MPRRRSSPRRSPKKSRRSPRRRTYRMTTATKMEIMKAHDQIVMVKELLAEGTSMVDQRRYGEAKPALDAAQRVLMALWATE